MLIARRSGQLCDFLRAAGAAAAAEGRADSAFFAAGEMVAVAMMAAELMMSNKQVYAQRSQEQSAA